MQDIGDNTPIKPFQESTSDEIRIPQYVASAHASSVIPALGVTFSTALDRWTRLRSACDAARISGDHGRAWRLFRLHDRIPLAVISATPRSLVDVLVILRFLSDAAYDAAKSEGFEVVRKTLQRVAVFLDEVVTADACRVVASFEDDAFAFSDTIAAFEAEALSLLSLPQTPNAAMRRAGAAAVGISEDQAEKVYAAMAGAYR